MTDYPQNDDDPQDPCHPFPPQDIDLFNRVLVSVRAEIEQLPAQEQHRVLLGLASECVDTTAQLAAIHRPGMRVVELTILAERLGALAHTYDA